MKIKELWLEFFHEPTGLCGLCANTGKIYHTVYTLEQFPTPVQLQGRFCICPNGRAKKKFSEKAVKKTV